jgi:hypothetical protein
MKKKHLFVIAALVAMASLATVLWARPFTISCPRDGSSMMFDHQVGIGRNAWCWYSHTACTAQKTSLEPRPIMFTFAKRRL